jgi:phage FluMu gp28-like protein
LLSEKEAAMITFKRNMREKWQQKIKTFERLMSKMSNSDESKELKILKVQKMMADEEKIKDRMSLDVAANADKKSNINSGLTSKRNSN